MSYPWLPFAIVAKFDDSFCHWNWNGSLFQLTFINKTKFDKVGLQNKSPQAMIKLTKSQSFENKENLFNRKGTFPSSLEEMKHEVKLQPEVWFRRPKDF